MRAFESGHPARKFLLAEFDGNGRSFRAVENAGDLSGAPQSPRLPFAARFTGLDFNL
jgi:hypothetical protein